MYVRFSSRNWECPAASWLYCTSKFESLSDYAPETHYYILWALHAPVDTRLLTNCKQ